jgi:DNA-binding response OmpR family regulator
MHNETVLIVEDTIIGQTILDFLRSQGFRCDWVKDAANMQQYLNNHQIDLLLLDVLLPDANGVDEVKTLRVQYPKLPIILMSSEFIQASDRVGGLKNGADDYMVKPLDLKELEAKIEAILRRSNDSNSGYTIDPQQHIYQFDQHTFDAHLGVLIFPDQRQEMLTMAERNLFIVFLKHPNKVLTRKELVKIVLGEQSLATERRTIDVRVSRLRRKIEPSSKHNCYIRTIRGEGYMFTPNGDHKKQG